MKVTIQYRRFTFTVPATFESPIGGPRYKVGYMPFYLACRTLNLKPKDVVLEACFSDEEAGINLGITRGSKLESGKSIYFKPILESMYA